MLTIHMARRGRRIKNDLPVIHALVVSGASTQAEITRLAFRDRRRPSQSSVQGPIVRLKSKGLVEAKGIIREGEKDVNKQDRRYSSELYSLNPSKWKEIVQIYFPHNEKDNRTMHEKVEFLSSGYADQVFDSEHFYELLIWMFLKWAVELDPDILNDIESSIKGGIAQQFIRSIPGNTQKQTRIVMDEFAKVFPLIRGMKRSDPEAESDVEKLVADRLNKKAILMVLGISPTELMKLAALARLSPSLIGYAMRRDTHTHKAPLEFTFNVSKLSGMSNWARDPDRQEILEAGKSISKEFRMFIWRFILIMVVHDMTELPQQEAEMLMTRAEVPSLQPYIEKVFNPYLRS